MEWDQMKMEIEKKSKIKIEEDKDEIGERGRRKQKRGEVVCSSTHTSGTMTE